MTDVSQQPAAPERPARYDRTFGGLIAAMIATVLFVVGFVAFRGLTRDNPQAEITPVDYLQSVVDLQRAGTEVVYPPQLPAGWVATSVDFERGTPPQWGLGVLTDDPGGREFVGLALAQRDVDDMLADYVDEDPDQGPDATPANQLGAATWETWSDTGGDHAFSTVLDSGPLAGQTVLVYGSAPVSELETFLGLLTTAPAAGKP